MKILDKYSVCYLYACRKVCVSLVPRLAWMLSTMTRLKEDKLISFLERREEKYECVLTMTPPVSNLPSS